MGFSCESMRQRWSKLTLTIQLLFDRCFYGWGAFVFRHPFAVIALSLLVTSTCTYFVQFMKSSTDSIGIAKVSDVTPHSKTNGQQYLTTVDFFIVCLFCVVLSANLQTQTTQSGKNAQVYESSWGSLKQDKTSGDKLFGIVFSSSINGNVFTRESMLDLLEIHNSINNYEYRGDKYSDVCILDSSTSQCYVSCFVEYFNFSEKIINQTFIRHDILSKIATNNTSNNSDIFENFINDIVNIILDDIDLTDLINDMFEKMGIDNDNHRRLFSWNNTISNWNNFSLWDNSSITIIITEIFEEIINCVTDVNTSYGIKLNTSWISLQELKEFEDIAVELVHLIEDIGLELTMDSLKLNLEKFTQIDFDMTSFSRTIEEFSQ